MAAGWILICIMMVVFGLLGLIGTLMRISEQAKKDLLEKMLKDGDISHSVYKNIYNFLIWDPKLQQTAKTAMMIITC